MRGSTQSGVGPTRGLDPAGSSAPLVATLRLEVGSQVSARVLEILGEGRILVGLRGVRVEARTEIPLQPGSTHLFTVLEAGETTRLVVSGKAQGVAGRSPAEALLHLLLARAGSLSLPGLLARLFEETKAAGEEEGRLGRLLAGLGKRPETVSNIRNLVRSLGLGLEAELDRAARTGQQLPSEVQGSLKAELLREVERGGSMRPTLEAALASLEGLQGENLHFGRMGGRILVPLPAFPGLRGGEIRFFPPAPEPGEDAGPGIDRPFRVLLLLDLERLGALRVGVESHGRDLRIRFECGKEETTRLVRDGLPCLRASLEAMGLRPMALEAAPLLIPRPEAPPAVVSGGAEPGRLDPGGLVDVEG